MIDLSYVRFVYMHTYKVSQLHVFKVMQIRPVFADLVTMIKSKNNDITFYNNFRFYRVYNC